MPRLIGFYANLLPVRISLDPAASLADLVKVCQDEVDFALDRRDVSFAELINSLGLPRDLSRHPLVSVGFNLDRHDRLPDFGTSARIESNIHGAVRWDLFFNLIESPEGFEIQADYSTALFDTKQIEAWVDQYLGLLNQFVETPESRQATPALLERVRDHAATRPNVSAVEDGLHSLTYAELLRESGDLAARLQSLGVRPGQAVAADLGRNVHMIVAMLGIWRAGGIYMPLEPVYPENYRRLLIAKGGAVCRICAPGDTLANLDATLQLELELASAALPASASLPVRIRPESAAYLLFTSGSTGEPKGVLVSHSSIAAYSQSICNRLGLPDDTKGERAWRFGLVSSLAADLGYTSVFGSLWTGGTLRIFSVSESRDPDGFANAMTASQIDFLKIVPTHLTALLNWPEPSVMLPQKCLVLGGEAPHWPLIESVWELLPACRVFNHYGPTETTIGAATIELTPSIKQVSPEHVPLGTPLDHALIRIEKIDDVEDSGEILIGGEGLANCYLKSGELAEDRFLPDRLGPEGTMIYRTGDRGKRLENGLLIFLGRLDDEIKIRGHRVAPGFVSAKLRECEGVRDAIVLAEINTHGLPGLAAYVVTIGSFDELLLRAWAATHLPAHMIPQAFHIVDELPRTPNGKPDRSKLRLESLNRVPATDPAETAKGSLLSIWREALDNPDAGPEDNFFAAGGDSILAIQIAGRARAIGLRFSAQQIFEYPTVNELLAFARKSIPQAAPALPHVDSEAAIPLSPVQHAFFDLRMPQPHHWCLSALLRLPGQPSAEALSQALSKLVQQHPAFRLRFRQIGKGISQYLAAAAAATPLLKAVEIGLSVLEKRKLEESLVSDCISGIDLAHGPLIAAALLDRGPAEPAALLVVVHHLIFDAVSWSVLAKDLCAHLDKPYLPVKPEPGFEAWCHSLQRLISSFVQELPFWHQTEAQIVPSLPRFANDTEINREKNVALEALEFSASVTSSLQKAAMSCDAGLNDVVLTALAATLMKHQKAPLVIDCEGHGREETGGPLQMERAIGWFTTHFPLALDVDISMPKAGQIAAVREIWRCVPSHGLGYGILRYMMAAEGLGRDPEISFNYLGKLGSGSRQNARFEEFGIGSERDPNAPRRYLVVVEAAVLEGALRIEVFYPRGTVEARFITEIKDGIEAWIETFANAELVSQLSSHLPGGLSLTMDDLQILSERLGL